MYRIHESDPAIESGGAGRGESGGVDGRRLTLIGVTSGVAAGRVMPRKGNAQVEWWTMFTTLDQFDTCLTSGLLRFGDPILFAQLRREFEHVLDRSNSPDVDPGSHA